MTTQQRFSLFTRNFSIGTVDPDFVDVKGGGFGDGQDRLCWSF